MERASITSRQISDVQVMEKFSFITVPFNEAEKIARIFNKKGRKPMVTRAKMKK